MEAAAILLVPGFGDDSSAYESLAKTALARRHRLIPLKLPGFGAPAMRGTTTIRRLAAFVDACAHREGARIVIAHSAASIIASFAAVRPATLIDTLLSLEGNLTCDDAYFSGTAADFPTALSFRANFLARLDDIARDLPSAARYRDAVARADPKALWDLGKDVRRFSSASAPGELLRRARRAVYFYNPDNISAASRDWLDRKALERVRLPNATHWKMCDQPDLLADLLGKSLSRLLAGSASRRN